MGNTHATPFLIRISGQIMNRIDSIKYGIEVEFYFLFIIWVNKQ